MIERLGSARFAPESFERFGVCSETLRQKLECHVPAQLGVPGLEYNPHSAAAQLLRDPVMGDERTCGDSVVRFACNFGLLLLPGQHLGCRFNGRRFDKTARLGVTLKQRFDLAAGIAVRRAGLVEKGCPLTFATAQYQASMAKATVADGLTSGFVKTGLYVISGGGGDTLLRLSANGLILVDGQRSDNYDALRKRVRKISEEPVRVLILTDYHANHIGNNAQFLAARAGIIAQQNVKQNLAAYDPPGQPVVAPTFAYDRDYTLKLGGVEAQLLHFGKCRNRQRHGGVLPQLEGGRGRGPFRQDTQSRFLSGRKPRGLGSVLDQVMKLDFDVAVPGTGPTVTKADVGAFKAKIDTVIARARQLVKSGVPKDELMAKLKTDDLGWQFNFTADQVNGFYAELSRMN